MKILLVKTSSLGDAIHTFPAVEYLRRRYPQAQIDWVVEWPLRHLIRSHPQINRVIILDTRTLRTRPWHQESWRHICKTIKALRHNQYDLLFDLQGNIKSGLVTALARAKAKVGYGRRSVFEWPNLLATHYRFDPPVGCNVRQEYLHLVGQKVGEIQDVPSGIVELKTARRDRELVEHLVGRRGLHVAVCPGSAWKNKRLSEGALFDFLERLHQRLQPHFLWVWGNDTEKDLVERLRQRYPETSVIVPKLALPALQFLMAQVSLVIAVDSLALHLAGTTQTPTFSAFGPSSPEKYKPTGLHHHIQGGCPYGQQFDRRCPRLRSCSTGACIRELTGEACFTAFISWWNRIR